MAESAGEVVRTTRDGSILTAYLNNPPGNNLNMDIFRALDACLDEVEKDGTDILILTGSGSVFSKGFDKDLMWSCHDEGELKRNLVYSNDVFTRLAECPKLTIAAINGHCLGGGLELSLCCDFRLCIEKARIGMPEIWSGMLPGLGGMHRLTGLIGYAKALELIALGDLMTAPQALAHGVVNRLLTRGSFESELMSFAKALVTVNQDVVREIKCLCKKTASLSDDECISQGLDAFARFAPWMQPESVEKA